MRMVQRLLVPFLLGAVVPALSGVLAGQPAAAAPAPVVQPGSTFDIPVTVDPSSPRWSDAILSEARAGVEVDLPVRSNMVTTHVQVNEVIVENVNTGERIFAYPGSVYFFPRWNSNRMGVRIFAFIPTDRVVRGFDSGYLYSVTYQVHLT